ncbi:MupG family TIM beta-alpha barrel fold protein [Fictibacillus sp. Mic-4]|uniref:MupG family TIM beta-alpha barrel fold protein n=1 Tax=Fictibacillus sp. Mic-4 TaxID=3132826 RepID=UPI003CE921A1
MIGISFYLNDPLAEKRIKEASEIGVKRAFTSLHIPEETGDLANRAKNLLCVAKELGMEVYADISARTPEHLGIDCFEDLTDLGVVGIRLDDFFDQQTIMRLSESFQIALNASIILEDEWFELLNSGIEKIRLIAWHNYYPRRETGLDENFFRKQMKLYQDYNIPSCAFVPGRGEKRGPLFEGLPTLEKHRWIDPFAAAVELFDDGVEEVYIGDPEPGAMLLEQLIKYDSNKVIPIRVKTASFKGGKYRPRPDFARDVLRLMNTRTTESVPPDNTVERPRGTVTVDNDLYGRYRGEIHITLQNLPADQRVNVIGSVVPEDLPLLSLIQPGQYIELCCLS